jgi:hypothetical protein
MRNALINGNPTINQRGYVSGTATTEANQYTLDRWRVVTSGQNISWTDSANVRTVTAPAGGVEQVVEGINLFSGSYVLSWTGTATATVAGSSVANGATVTLVGGVDTTVRFSGGTFALAQLEPGTRSTPFERRSYGQELALCQRYFCRISSANGYPATATLAYLSPLFPVEMRATPTLITSAVLTITDGALNYTQSTAAVFQYVGNARGGLVTFTNFSGMTAYRPMALNTSAFNDTFVASAEL